MVPMIVLMLFFKKTLLTQLKNDCSMTVTVPDPDALLLLWFFCLIHCDVLLLLGASALLLKICTS